MKKSSSWNFVVLDENCTPQVQRGVRPGQQFQLLKRQPHAPQQQHGQQNEIQFNIEHVFEENGKKVRKMPIRIPGQTIWVDCAEQPSGSTVTSTTSDSGAATASPSPTANMPKPVSTRRSIQELTNEEKNQIVNDCCVRLISLQVLSNKYALSVQAIRTLVKDSGRALPAKYNSKAEHGPKSRPPSQPGIQPMDDNTITLYPGAPSEGSLSPPAQVVRHQLVVTDNNAGMQNGQGTNQLQLPQNPTPPMGLPKLVPAQAKVPPLPVQPKTIPGKIAVCPNCGLYSVHIDRCQGCKKVIREGAKIMPDPDYKPPIISSSSSFQRPSLAPQQPQKRPPPQPEPQQNDGILSENKRKMVVQAGNPAPLQEVNDDECTICYEPRNPAYMFYPCGHATFCKNCATRLFEKSEKKCFFLNLKRKRLQIFHQI